MAKKYYWLKLMNDFFQQPKIKKLRRIAGGDTYTVIYLKLQLLSLQDEGKLFFEEIEENFAEELALTIDEDTENVRVTLGYLLSQGLIEQISQNEYFLPETVKLIGSETDAAERMRRIRQKKPELLEERNNGEQCSQMFTEIEKEKEIEKEPEKEKKQEPKKKTKKKKEEPQPEVAEIIEYLNFRAGTNYRTSNKEAQRLIKALLNANPPYTVADCKAVIDKKAFEWVGTDMQQYLRPSTLFGNKFDGYLNSPSPVAVKKQQPQQQASTFERLQNMLLEEEMRERGELYEYSRNDKDFCSLAKQLS